MPSLFHRELRDVFVWQLNSLSFSIRGSCFNLIVFTSQNEKIVFKEEAANDWGLSLAVLTIKSTKAQNENLHSIQPSQRV